jgi:hypothetical protein
MLNDRKKPRFSQREVGLFIFAMLQWFADLLISFNVTVAGIRDLDLSDYMAGEMKCFTENISFSVV